MPISTEGREVMNESLYDSTKKCGDCALFSTDACYLVTYVDEEHDACDEYIGYMEKEEA